MSTNDKKPRMFVTADGKNVAFTFILITTLFFLWALCNGMIDVMDKHFQDELGLTKSQSAWVQFAHYLGYFLMSMPAGWLAVKLGYKGGIIAGLLMVALGGLWFIPATQIAEFWAFLVGVCFIASGLTFLETIANPYTTVLGDPKFAATRINLAQSANGIGWIFGPVVGSIFFYSTDARGVSTGSETLYIPYVTIAVVVALLAVVFYFAKVPDIKSEDDYHVDDASADTPSTERQLNRLLIYLCLVLNAAVLVGITSFILSLILGGLLSKSIAAGIGEHLVGLASIVAKPLGMVATADNAVSILVYAVGVIGALIAAVALVPATRRISHHSIWSHPHFSAATLTQFAYVAAQAGIFSFFINTLTRDSRTGFTMVPAIPPSWDSGITSLAEKLPWLHGWLTGWFNNVDGLLYFSDKGASNLLSIGFVFFALGRCLGTVVVKKYSAHTVLGVYGLVNVIACLLVFGNLGWLSVAAVFMTFFFMSIMFPTIFVLGIYGLGTRAKRASSFIVMAIMGGAVLPKLMGWVGDHYNMSTSYLVPMGCFVVVMLYAFSWPRLSQMEAVKTLKAGGH